MSKELIIRAAERAQAELGALRNALAVALNEIQRPIPDYFKVTDHLVDVAQHNVKASDELVHLGDLYRAMVESWKTQGEPPLPGQTTLKSVK